MAAAAAAIGIIVPWSVPNYTAGRRGIIIIITLLKKHMPDAHAYIIRTSQMKHTNKELY